jgi:hypothetical protein
MNFADGGGGSVVPPQFKQIWGPSGVRIWDPIEDVRAKLFTPKSVEISPASGDPFVYPVDNAASIETSEIETEFLVTLWIRDENGEMIAEYKAENGHVWFPSDTYMIEVSGVSVKLYLFVRDSSITLREGEKGVVLAFEEETEVQIGTRSLHYQPAGTITTTTDPMDLMEVVSVLGDSMKTWSPERTFPTLRGHPLLVEEGDSLEIPDGVTKPETGVEITVPPEYKWIYPVAPLAYWLGATVSPGEPMLYADGTEVPLTTGEPGTPSGQEAFHHRVRDILQYSFLLDCAVRTEGFYNVQLDVREQVEAEFSLPFEELYDLPLDERLSTYFGLVDSVEAFESRLGRPEWRLTADMEAESDRISVLPFLARDLAVVRCPKEAGLAKLEAEETSPWGETQSSGGDANPWGGQEVRRGGGSVSGSVTTQSGVSTRSASDDHSGGSQPVLELPETDSMAHTWIGEGFAFGAGKASTQSYLQRLEKIVEDESLVSIDVVMNAEEMADESAVSDIYGTRENIEFQTDVHEQLSTDELAAVLESDRDFLHYIGHVDDRGFECCDGFLDAESLGNVGVDIFVLNACSSYEQGLALVNKGSIAGVVTLNDVINSSATRVGKELARLINYGFPMETAIQLIYETSFLGHDYVVIGDSTAALTQSSVPAPNLKRVELTDGGKFSVEIETFASLNYDTGSMYEPYIAGNELHYVVPKTLGPWEITKQELEDLLGKANYPVVASGKLYWSEEVTVEEIYERLDV